MVTKLTWKINL